MEWWKFGYHNVFSWQLPPFWVAMLFSYLLVGFHIWQLVIHGSWDPVTLGNKECCPWQHNFYSQFPGNFSTEYLILHSFILHPWTYSSVSLFFTGCFWREDKTLPLQCKQQLLFTVLFRWLHVYLGNTPVNIWVYLLAFFCCVVVNFSVF